MLTQEKKTELIKEYQLEEGDTGSPEVQIAILSYKIKEFWWLSVWFLTLPAAVSKTVTSLISTSVSLVFRAMSG